MNLQVNKKEKNIFTDFLLPGLDTNFNITP